MLRETERSTLEATYALTASAGTTPEIDISHHAWGCIFIPTGSGITSLTYHSAPRYGGTYLAAYDAALAAITQTVSAAKAYPVPAALFGAGAIRIVANTTGNVIVSLKS